MSPGDLAAIVRYLPHQGEVITLSKVVRITDRFIVTEAGPFPRRGEKDGAHVRAATPDDRLRSKIYSLCLSARLFVPNTFKVVPTTIEGAFEALDAAREKLKTLEDALWRLSSEEEKEDGQLDS